jgi:hypothetical protein
MIADYVLQRVVPLAVDMELGEALDDGHSLLEVYDPKRKQRVLADTDMGYMFENEGRFLSAIDLWRLIREGKDFDLVRLARVEIDPEFPLAVYSRLQAARPERVKDWYRPRTGTAGCSTLSPSTGMPWFRTRPPADA